MAERQLWKTTIVIWSEYDPRDIEIEDLARDVTNGESYCATSQSLLILHPSADEDWDETEFFDPFDEAPVEEWETL